MSEKQENPLNEDISISITGPGQDQKKILVTTAIIVALLGLMLLSGYAWITSDPGNVTIQCERYGVTIDCPPEISEPSRIGFTLPGEYIDNLTFDNKSINELLKYWVRP